MTHDAHAHAGAAIAIVGSGPSGCYLAQALLRGLPDATITIIDRLVSPFGLIRYGVAADHQHTKAITRQFDRLFQDERVRFAGDVEIGRDVSLAELRAAYDVVVLATGLAADRRLPIPGGDLPGVFGAGRLTRILNAHPDAPETLPELGADVVVIGAGNVALDLLRFLVKDTEGYSASDVADDALATYLAHPADRVTLASRSDAAHSKGDPQMLKELAALPRGRYALGSRGPERADSELDRTEQARAAAIAELTSPDRADHPGPLVTLRFGAMPIRVLGDDCVEGVEFAVGDEIVAVPATSVVTAIGFDAVAGDEASAVIAGLAPDPDSGRIEPGLYRSGWAQRGPRGAIPENRAYAKRVADEIVGDLRAGEVSPDPGKSGFDTLPETVRSRAITYAHWLVLEAHERESAPADRVRRKHASHTHMADIARGATVAH